MSRFKFKEWLFKNYFPQYYKDEDTYKDENGKGILEKFIEICAEYFDESIVPDIDTLLDKIDVDKTDTIFLNYLWEYFGELPLAWGILTKGIDHWDPNTYNVIKWVNTLKGYPKADSRKVLKYIISLYKIRGTALFYEVLARFYGIKLELIQIPCETCSPNPNQDIEGISKSSSPTPYNLYKAHYEDKVGYFPDHEPPIIGAFPLGELPEDNCYDCVCYKLRLGIPSGIWNQITSLPDGDKRKKDIGNIFTSIVTKYLPIYAKICDNAIDIYSWDNTIAAEAPPQINPNIVESSKDLDILPGNSSGIIISPESLSILPDDFTISILERIAISAEILPKGADWNDINWSYEGYGSTPGKITLNSTLNYCEVVGVEIGECLITCEVTDPKTGSKISNTSHVKVVQGSLQIVKAHFEQKSASYDEIGAGFVINPSKK